MDIIIFHFLRAAVINAKILYDYKVANTSLLSFIQLVIKEWSGSELLDSDNNPHSDIADAGDSDDSEEVFVAPQSTN